jgi:hypothetical protein
MSDISPFGLRNISTFALYVCSHVHNCIFEPAFHCRTSIKATKVYMCSSNNFARCWGHWTAVRLLKVVFSQCFDFIKVCLAEHFISRCLWHALHYS